MKLPHDWWLFGIDLQLLHEIDQQQLWYFEGILETVKPDERIILCSPEPYWIERAPKAVGSSELVTSLFETLRDKMGEQLRLVISGDLHHYQRLSSDDDRRHHITCGTGGAFLHPTHVFNLEPRDGLSLSASYPKAEKSRRLTWLNLLFLFKNPWFGIVLSGFYLFIAFCLQATVGGKFGHNEGDFLQVMGAGFGSMISTLPVLALCVVVLLVFVRFTVTKSRWFRWIGGSLHALSHFLIACFLFLAASYICNQVYSETLKSILQYLLVVASAWIVGWILIGLYLAISLNVFHEHTTEAFSSLRISDWKGFLRMHLCNTGELELYFVGIGRVPRKWREVDPEAVPRWVSNDALAEAAQLEDYVRIKL